MPGSRKKKKKLSTNLKLLIDKYIPRKVNDLCVHRGKKREIGEWFKNKERRMMNDFNWTDGMCKEYGG